MKKYADYREQVKAFREVTSKALSLNSEDEMCALLSAEFAADFDNCDLFSQFIGYCAAEFKDPTVKAERYKLVMLFSSLAIQGLSCGWKGGYLQAKKIFTPGLGVRKNGVPT